MKCVLVLLSGLLIPYAVLAADPSPAPAPAPSSSALPRSSGGKSVSSEIKKHRLPGQPVGVRAHGGGSEAPGASGASLDPSQQSSIGAGIQIRLGKDPDEDRGPKYDKNDDQE